MQKVWDQWGLTYVFVCFLICFLQVINGIKCGLKCIDTASWSFVWYTRTKHSESIKISLPCLPAPLAPNTTMMDLLYLFYYSYVLVRRNAIALFFVTVVTKL